MSIYMLRYPTLRGHSCQATPERSSNVISRMLVDKVVMIDECIISIAVKLAICMYPDNLGLVIPSRDIDMVSSVRSQFSVTNEWYYMKLKINMVP